MQKKTQICLVLILFLTTLSNHIQTALQKTPLHDAARTGNVDEIIRLAKLGADVNAHDRNQYPPLLSAVFNEHIEAIEKLIELGADKNIRTYKGIAPLHLAARYGRKRAIEALIKLQADIDIHDSYQNTPLCYAAYYGHAHATEILIRHGANKSAQNSFKHAPNQLIYKLVKIAPQDCGFIHPITIKALLRWYTPQKAQQLDRVRNTLFEETVKYAYQQYQNKEPKLLATMLAIPKKPSKLTTLLQKITQAAHQQHKTQSLSLPARNIPTQEQTTQKAKPMTHLPSRKTTEKIYDLFEPKTLQAIIDDLQKQSPELQFKTNSVLSVLHDRITKPF